MVKDKISIYLPENFAIIHDSKISKKEIKRLFAGTGIKISRSKAMRYGFGRIFK